MKKNNKTVLHYLNQVAGRMKLYIGALLLLEMSLGVCGAVSALLVRNIINEAVAGHRQMFFQWIIWLGCLFVFRVVARWGQRRLEEYTRSTLENRLKDRLFSSLLRKDYAAVTAVHSGEWINRLTSDTVVVANGMTEILPGLGEMLVKLISVLVAMVALEPRFCYIMIPGGIALVCLTYSFRKIMKRLHKDIQEKDGKLRVLLQETLGSLLVVRAFAKEDAMQEEAQEKMNAHRKARMRRNRFSTGCNVGFAVLFNGVYLLGALFCGYGILTGTMSYGSFTAILQLVSQIQTPFANISGFLPRYYAMTASAERLMAAEEMPDADRKAIHSQAEISDLYARDFQSLGIAEGAFTYQPPVREPETSGKQEQTVMPIVLQNVNLEIKKGESVAFTGHSGCGKSTVMKLLLCLYPLDSGRRYLKTADRETPLTGDYQRLFAYVPQGNHLMSGTVREVVSFLDGKQTYDEERMWRALEIACADQFVREMDSGLETRLGERGMGLSEGQMQRLAIARAIYADSPILMLDECTSALDEETERRLLRNLQAMTDKTVLIVTHRPAALEICDRVIAFTESGCQEQAVREVEHT